MNAFRRSLVEHGDLESEMPRDAAFLMGHRAAAAFILAGLARTYPELLRRLEAEGPTADLEEEAFDAAGTLATVLPVPMTVLDQLFHSFVLLTEGSTEEDRLAALTASGLQQLMNTRKVRAWMDRVGAEKMYEPPEGAPGEGSPEE